MAQRLAILNLELSCALITCGGMFQFIVEFASTLGLKFPSYRTLSNLASAFVYPAINEVYTRQQEELLQEVKERNKEKLIVACEYDGRRSEEVLLQNHNFLNSR